MSNENENKDTMPIWISHAEIEPKWIEAKTGLSGVSKCQVRDISNATRKGDEIRNGATLKLKITTKNSSSISLVIKQVPPSGRPMSRQLGLAREALFYDLLASQVEGKGDDGKIIIPKIYYAHGDVESGAKIIIMEDLSDNYLDSGVLFGPGNPNNWSRDLPEMIQTAYGNDQQPPSSFEVANQTFRAMAKIHATFWNDSELLQHSWLRGSNWIQEKDQESWQASQGLIQGIWKKGIDDKVEWDPLVKATLDKAMEGISWEAQLKRLNNTMNNNWTLVHGDFWPGNVLVSTKKSDELRLLDWEMTGIGSGPQDLGQYILSNMDPTDRRACEKKLVQNYYNELSSCGVSNFSWDDCWKEYRIGGLERWLWFLVYFCGQEGPLLEWGQFFHNQIAAFLKDHELGPDDVVQPRP